MLLNEGKQNWCFPNIALSRSRVMGYRPVTSYCKVLPPPWDNVLDIV